MRSLVSIIVPCYNSETWIAEAIRSALDQTWETKEIIVIDDGSTDGSLSVIKSFGDSIRWETGPNRGGCAARNRGIELAQGDYIQFLDSDDVLVPDCVEGKMEFQCAPDERVCSGVDSWDAASAGKMVDYWQGTFYGLEFMIRTGTPATPSPLHRKRDLETIGGFRAELTCAQEFDLHLRMAAQLGIHFVSNGKIGAKIRRREESVSLSAGKRMFLVSASILMDLWGWMEHQPGVDREKMASAISQRLTGIARLLYWRGAREEAVALAATARALHPSWHKSAYRTNVGGMLANIIGFEGFERLHRFLR
jgi:hypothetical protein